MAPHSETSSDWQIKCTKLKKRAQHLYYSRDWADCSFQFDIPGEPSARISTVRAHKLFLAMASPVFAAQMYGSLDEQDPICVTDIDEDIFCIMLRYIYTDEIEALSVAKAIDLYYAAKKYILHHLQEECIFYLLEKLDSNNVCRIYEFSCFHNENLLKQKCLKIFSKKTWDIFRSGNFLKAKLETVKQIVSMEPLNICNELDLFNALVHYADNELKNTNLAEKMATTLCSLFEEYSTKKSQLGAALSKKRMSSSSDSDASSSESEIEERPSISSVVVASDTANKSQDKAELVRQMLRPCVEQIRFLTLTPREFAECKQLATLFSNEEIMAVAMNIASKDTAVPMPAGFSKSVVPRNWLYKRPTATIRFTVNNIILVKKFTSEVFCARYIAWSVTVLVQEKRKSDTNERQKYLRVELECLLQREGTWSCQTAYTIRTIAQSNANVQSFNLPIQKHTYTFSNKKTSVGHLYLWNTFGYTPAAAAKSKIDRLDPITFEVHIEPQKPTSVATVSAMPKQTSSKK